MIVFMKVIVNVPLIQGIQDNMKNNEQLRKTSGIHQNQTRLRRRRKMNIHHQYENYRYSICENNEISFGISITSNVNQGGISWSVESSNEEDAIHSSPLFSSHFTRFTYDHQLCFDETKCHKFKIHDTFGGDIRTLQQISSTTSFSVSLNNIIVFENPGHAFSSFSFDFGQCQSLAPITTITKNVRSSNQSSISHPSESPTLSPTIEKNEYVSKRCETEILIVVVLLLIVLVPRIGSLLCCVRLTWCIRSYMNSQEDENDTKSDCDTTISSTFSGHDDKTNLNEIGKEEIDHMPNSGSFESLMGNISSVFRKD